MGVRTGLSTLVKVTVVSAAGLPQAARMLSELLDLVAPERCVGCARRSLWCEDCRSALTRARWVSRAGVPLVTPAAASPVMMRAIAQWKDAHYRQLSEVLADLLLPELVAEFDSRPLNVVLIPSRKKSLRTRGYQPMVDVVEKLARKSDGQFQLAPRVLAWRVQPTEQRQLDDVRRERNVAGRMAADRLPSGQLLLLDDVVTSGATIREALRALTDAGVRPVGIAALAVPRNNLGQDFVKSVAKPRLRI